MPPAAYNQIRTSEIIAMGNSRGPWIRFGGVAGLLSIAAYLSIAFRLLPLPACRVVSLLLPIGGILFLTGLGQLLRRHRNGFIVEAATLLGIIGFSVMSVASAVPDAADRVSSFGITTQISVFLFAVAITGDKRFGWRFGSVGSVCTAAILVVSLYRFPRAADPDLSPVIGLWLAAVAIRMLTLSYVPVTRPARSRRKQASDHRVHAAVVE